LSGAAADPAKSDSGAALTPASDTVRIAGLVPSATEHIRPPPTEAPHKLHVPPDRRPQAREPPALPFIHGGSSTGHLLGGCRGAGPPHARKKNRACVTIGRAHFRMVVGRPQALSRSGGPTGTPAAFG
jgi:hypothetical protein